MNLKLILSGIALLTLLVACDDRSNEDAPALQSEGTKADLKAAKNVKIVSDTVTKPVEKPNEPDSKDGTSNSTADTIDPTKPDRPK
ncbi:hypothetical protein ACNFU2_14575 [Chryseobacterium sp. PTM-20240506]|uniref:hypothetical protein n=1 Tax=unclassified Chryseobacterium TaxID=2593645 RepID=UPI0023598F6B|nr:MULTISPECIES: hypothetical protein [unclassified Chryseobacterium]MDC8106111.1 hypothetical protein [Chryseobacterium sp. B21-037]MDQ1804615.1 hypothetical protein [Chryseobacterium sp. CKR4-1]